MAKFGTFSSAYMFDTVGDEDGVDVGTGDDPRALIGDEDGLTSVKDDLASIGDGDGVGATS